jgi:flagellin
MTRINTNVASIRGLRSLNKSTNLLDTSLTRLSTGLKINSGKDNPSGLIASETLRSQVSAIEQSIKNSNRASNVIATADSALGEVTNLLNQVRGLVQEGLNVGALSQDEIKANQLQIDTALSAINRISANTSFAGDKLIDGSKAFRTQASAGDSARLSGQRSGIRFQQFDYTGCDYRDCRDSSQSGLRSCTR